MYCDNVGEIEGGNIHRLSFQFLINNDNKEMIDGIVSREVF